jgi:Zn-dependent peptidase ImmA (M78 family)
MVKLNFRTKKNGVPILSKYEIEEMAEMIIRDYDEDIYSNPKSLDIEHFSEYYAELELDYQDLTNNKSILGMTVFNDCYIPVYDAVHNKAKKIPVHEGTVLLDNSLLAEDQLRRGRFTLSHEVSHWFLHQEKYRTDKNQVSIFDDKQSQPVIKCRATNIESNSKKKLITDDDWIEYHADHMAAALLMPKKAFTNVVKDKFSSAGIRSRYYKIRTDFEQSVRLEEITYEIADIFDVSLTATKIRLMDLGFVKDEQENRQYSLKLDF